MQNEEMVAGKRIRFNPPYPHHPRFNQFFRVSDTGKRA